MLLANLQRVCVKADLTISSYRFCATWDSVVVPEKEEIGVAPINTNPLEAMSMSLPDAVDVVVVIYNSRGVAIANSPILYGYANAVVVTVALPVVDDTVKTSTAAVPPVAETTRIMSNCFKLLVTELK